MTIGSIYGMDDSLYLTLTYKLVRELPLLTWWQQNSFSGNNNKQARQQVKKHVIIFLSLENQSNLIQSDLRDIFKISQRKERQTLDHVILFRRTSIELWHLNNCIHFTQWFYSESTLQEINSLWHERSFATVSSDESEFWHGKLWISFVWTKWMVTL